MPPFATRVDPVLHEKMAHAFKLVNKLAQSGLSFTFKGGTSIGLLCGSLDRFSIDVDILTTASREELENHLQAITSQRDFTRFELDTKRSYRSRLPKAHYKIYFNSTYQGSGHVLLDVLYSSWEYPETFPGPFRNPITQEELDSKIKVPSISSLIGDKLSAFAPNTIGIPYVKGNHSRSLEIIKQLYDLNTLITQGYVHHVAFETYQQTALRECSFRNLDCSIDQCLDDNLTACITIASRGTIAFDHQRFTELQNGIKSLGTGYLINKNFRIEEAVLASGRIAILAQSFRSIPYSLPINPWPFIPKLAKTSQTAHEIWMQFWTNGST
jgi:hypothetical protein